MKGTYLSSPVELGPVETSIGHLLLDRQERWGQRAAFSERGADGHYRALSWFDLVAQVQHLALALSDLGVTPGDRVAVYSRNCQEMLLWELATMSLGALSVPIFSRYGSPQVEFLLEHSRARLVMCTDGEHLARLRGTASFERLRPVVVARMTGLIADEGEILPFSQLIEAKTDRVLANRRFLALISRVEASSPCLVMYTSGTTGTPKGVVLTHGNILSQQKALSLTWDLGPDDRFLSYLPWHHSFGGLFERFSALSSGAVLCLDDSGGRDLGRLLENWTQVRPTVFFSVPKIYSALVTEAQNDQGVDRTIFGQGLRFVFTAAAPLAQHCSDYFAYKGIPVLEGWGLTETSPCVTLTSPAAERISAVVGWPLPGVEVLVGPDQEIHVRGPNVMVGYYRDAERTARSKDAQGWFHTGDLGEATPNGLRIICRVDGIFKLANGEKVSSLLVENALTGTSRLIEQAIVVGAGKEYLAALIFPNLRNLAALLEQTRDRDFANSREAGATNAGNATPLWDDPAVLRLFEEEVRSQNALVEPRFARVQAFALVFDELTIENGELTPSLKVVRTQVLERYAPVVKALFQEPGHDPGLARSIVRLDASQELRLGVASASGVTESPRPTMVSE